MLVFFCLVYVGESKVSFFRLEENKRCIITSFSATMPRWHPAGDLETKRLHKAMSYIFIMINCRRLSPLRDPSRLEFANDANTMRQRAAARQKTRFQKIMLGARAFFILRRHHTEEKVCHRFARTTKRNQLGIVFFFYAIYLCINKYLLLGGKWRAVRNWRKLIELLNYSRACLKTRYFSILSRRRFIVHPAVFNARNFR